MKILQGETIYKNFYSKLFVDMGPGYITLLNKVYLTDNGTIYLEGQNMRSQLILKTLEEQREILESNFKRWEDSKGDNTINSVGALEFLEDKLFFLEKISEDLRVK